MDLEKSLSNICIKDVNVKTTNNLEDSSKDDSRLPSASDDEDKEKFMSLIKKGRQMTEDGDIANAVMVYEKALKIRFSEKLQKRIKKMKDFLAEQTAEDDKPHNDMKSLGNGFYLHYKLYDKLYPHQKEGVLWLWSLFQKRKGGILADDMGLGKTIQIIAFLAGMFDTQNAKYVMIVVPLSVMPNWLNEFNKWTPGINVQEYHGSSKKERERALAKVRSRGGVLLITYGLVITTKEILAERHGQEFVWDYIILDEGHKIKNTTKTSKSVHLVPARNRIILTGTPVQNNLKEMWSLFDYVHQGSLLGTLRTFKMEFETPIIRARERDSTAVEKKLGQEMSETLKKIIKPYFLRRTKAEVQQSRKDSSQDDSKSLQMPSLTRKNDLVIWLKLTETQQKIYKDFLALDTVKELLMTKKSPLVALTVLKKICDHPRLLSTRACMQLGLDGEDFDEEILESAESYESAVSQINNIPNDVLINESGKMIILAELLKSFKEEGHKTLIFSQSRKILDIIQKILYSLGHKVLRLDGTITNLMARDELVQKFQKDPSYSAFLLTIQVGGVGLTITAADRVVIYDPSWNPATDAQAVDRAYRIGQQKNVVIYRLITCGTVEEKIYRRQVFKDSITRQTTGNTKNPYRYFTKMELKELFTLDDPNFSKTQQQLQELHSHQRLTDEALDEHIAYLYSLDIFGISDHDLMYKQVDVQDKEDDEDDDESLSGETAERDVGFIQHKIQKAQMLIAEESTVPSTYEERSKGMMKYPSGSGAAAGGTYRPTNYFQPPQASPLFTEVSSGGESDPINVSNNSTDDLASEIQNISVSQDDIVSKEKFEKEMLSPSKNHFSPSGASRRPLQPLSSDEVKKRSPLIANKPGKVLEEELVFSPDTNSPIIKLERSDIRQKMSPMKLFGSPVKDSFSPKKKDSLSAICAHPNSLKMATDSSPAKCSTPKSSKGFIAKKILTDSLLMKTGPHSPNLSPKKNVLVEASPASPLFESSSKAESSFISSTPSSDASSACRKLFVEETPDTGRKENCQDDSRLMEHSGAATEDFLSLSNASSRTHKNKRRSVCLQQPTVISSSDDSEGDSSDRENRHAGNEESDGYNIHNLSGMNEDDNDDYDKENDPVMFRRAGRRNVIVSDSESEADSCYEISDDDEIKPDVPGGENYRNSQAEVSMEECLEEQDEEDKEMEDEDEEEEEEELNPIFLQLVQEARSLYKKKDYAGSLQYVEKALEIEQPPELQDMAEKIRALISNLQS